MLKSSNNTFTMSIQNFINHVHSAGSSKVQVPKPPELHPFPWLLHLLRQGHHAILQRWQVAGSHLPPSSKWKWNLSGSAWWGSGIYCTYELTCMCKYVYIYIWHKLHKWGVYNIYIYVFRGYCIYMIYIYIWDRSIHVGSTGLPHSICRFQRVEW